MSLRAYLKSKHSSEVIGGGEFRKKGSRIKSWKIRAYYIKDDGMLLYFDPVSKEPKGVFDIYNCTLSLGNVENLSKSGCKNFSVEAGHAFNLCNPSDPKVLELVFDTTKEAKKFCLLLSSGASTEAVPNLLVGDGNLDFSDCVIFFRILSETP
jgi:hypothetical protein